MARLIIRQNSRSYAGRLKAVEHLRRERIKTTERLKQQGIKEIGQLTNNEIFLAGIGLYWGEGYRSHERIGFTSKDEKIVKFIITWFKKFLNAKNSDFILRVSINNDHKDRIHKVEKYWSLILKIPRRQFTKPSFIKSKLKKIYLSKENYYGTLRITVRKSCAMHRKFMGWIDGLYNNMMLSRRYLS